MQTTLRINDDIYRRAKAKSGELGQSLTRFFEEAAEEYLIRLGQARPAGRISLPVSSVFGQTIGQDKLNHVIAAADLATDQRQRD